MSKKKKKIVKIIKKKKKKYNLKSKITSSLRKVWYYSEMRRDAKARCKVDKDTYRCEKCRRLTKEIQIDHNPPVVPLTGFDDWNGYISRLFVDPLIGLFCLCPSCHEQITKVQNEVRKENRKK